jgi:hypothetical protein
MGKRTTTDPVPSSSRSRSTCLIPSGLLPGLLPLETAFCTRTTALRQAGARHRAALEDAITAGLATITAEDDVGWFGHGGDAESEQLV